MKKFLLVLVALVGMQSSFAQQTKRIELLAIAEGNFGSTNGDVFKLSNSTGEMVAEGSLYQNANGATTGFNVLQDFQIVGDKAIFASNAAGFKVVIAAYPSLTEIETFPNMGSPASIVGDGANFAYISSSNPVKLRRIDLITNTITEVVDAEGFVSGSSKYMAYGNGYFYVALGSSILKVDPLTNTTLSKFTLQIGSITGLQYDSETQSLWALGKVSGTSALQEVITADDSLEEPIVLTGVSNASQLRLGNNKLYFLSGLNVHAYDINTPNIPTTSIYTSTFSNSFSFAYGKAFHVDPISGDFVIGDASGFTGASAYEIIDGTTYELLASGTVAGCIGVNELILKTEANLSTDLPEAAKFTFYPNPVSDVINFHNGNDDGFDIVIFNQLGAQVKVASSNTADCKVLVSDLPSGIYFAQIQSQNSKLNVVKKIIVTH